MVYYSYRMRLATQWRTVVEGCHHDLRRTGVRHLQRAGVDRKVAMAISGRRSESVFERYIDTDEDLREAVEKVATYVGTLPTSSSVVPMRDSGR